MSSRHWRRLVGAVTVVLAVAAAAPTGLAAAAPGAGLTGAAVPATPLNPVTLGGAAGAAVTPVELAQGSLSGATKVTLVTGDVVSYLADPAGGAPQVQVTPAPRANGRLVAFTQVKDGDAFYVIPSDTRGLLGSDRLDKSLFDVAYLVNNGYADDKATQLPVIVQYPTRTSSDARALSTKADALPATAKVTALPAARSAAVKVSKTQARAFWAGVDAVSPTSTTLDAGVSKIWLDHRTRATLDVSVPQIGAPGAWQAGYDGTGVKVAVLDTGIDESHPDFAGKIIEARSFVEGETARDGHGHGTHVASTIVGSGAASGGKYKGVAPGAKLLIGKVLGDAGTGSDTEIIAGMQWAAEQGAKIVSISVGGAFTDGTDPMSQTVNELSAQYGMLFVIAAGNSGRSGPRTIEAPGVADGALTVAAVTKQDEMADFSSRGPRLGNFGLKPDIAAPGVDITAAKADGTALGPVVDDSYTTISGTSMATPHVSGAAAILAQQHPDWSGQKLKAVLTSTSKNDGFSSYEQGAGRVDIARARGQMVYATNNVDFGRVVFPYKTPVGKTLTYVNDGDAPVTLNLTSSLTPNGGGTAPAGMLTLDRGTVTVPAHGSADVTTTFDATKGGATTWYGGAVEAIDAAGAVRVRTAVGAYKEPKMSNITTRWVDPAAANDIQYFGILLLRLDEAPGVDSKFVSLPAKEHTGRIPAGTYAVVSDATWLGANGQLNYAMVGEPTVVVDGDTTVTFDLRRLKRVQVTTPKKAVPYETLVGAKVVSENAKSLMQDFWKVPYGNDHNMWTLPSKSKATLGDFTYYSKFFLGPDPVTMTVPGQRGSKPIRLHPMYSAIHTDSYGQPVAMLDKRGSVPLVHAGHGLPEDFTNVDARGKLVLLDLSDICPADAEKKFGFPCETGGLDRVENAQRAGALGVLGYGEVGRSFLGGLGRNGFYFGWDLYPIPTMGLLADEGRMLADRLSRQPVTLDVTASSTTPYVYNLFYTDTRRLPSAVNYRLTDRQLYAIKNRMHGDAPGEAGLAWTPNTDRGLIMLGASLPLRGQSAVTSYFGPVGRDLGWTRAAGYVYDTGGQAWSASTSDRFIRAGSRVQDWGEQPLVPAVQRVDPKQTRHGLYFCTSCRSGDMFNPAHVLTRDGEGGGLAPYRYNANQPEITKVRLYKKDGTEVPRKDGQWFFFLSGFLNPYFDLPAEKAEYRLVERFETPLEQRYARIVDTTRTFTSQRGTGGIVGPRNVERGLNCYSWFTHIRNADGTLSPPSQESCQPNRELYLGYDFDLDLDNTLPAESKQKFTVNGYYSPYLTKAPRMTSLKLWISTDDGAHWTAIRTKAAGNGTFTGTVTHPALSQTTGAVSIKAEATDSEGGTVSQVVHRAYGLRAN
ncbi:S8 family peptidase [Micromonospora sp. CA-111912]|uniref:S8 family peptidase n=1 Tax=Micromonospora sp. CA-111912 TaxID=3239955 RepID=UPI003D8B3A49